MKELLNATASMVDRPRKLLKAVRLLPRSMWLPYISITGLIIGAFIVDEWSIEAVRNEGRGIAALIETQRELGALRASLVDAETAERGYLLSHDERYLEPYARAQESIPVVIGQLRASAQEDPELASVLTGLQSMERRGFGFIAAVVEAAHKGNEQQAVELFRAGSGRVLMDAYRAATDKALARIDRRLDAAYREEAGDVLYSRFAALFVGVLAIGLLVFVLRLLLARAARDASQRQELEAAVALRTEDLFELSKYLQLMQERERADLARNLHDELGGLMTAAKMDLAATQEFPGAADPQMAEKLTEIAKILDTAMQIKRRVVEGLRPALLDHFGPVAAISTYVEENGQRAGLAVTSRIDPSFDSVDPDVALSVFRLVQEALTNSIRHARATRFTVTLVREGDCHLLTIEDDGVGLGRGKRRGSHGLVGMNHRVRVLGGSIAFGRGAKGGVRIDIKIPRLVAETGDERSTGVPTAELIGT
jgi:signal transduction histidine kinase